VVAVVAVVAQTAAQLIDFDIYHLRIGALSSEQHASVFGVASICANGLAAVAAAAAGRTAGPRSSWALVSALIAIVMVLRIGNVGDGDPKRYVLLLPLVGVILVLLWRLTSREPAGARTEARAGIGLLVFSYVVHVFGPRIVADLGYGTGGWVYQVRGILKHGGELAGWILVATGLAAFARATPDYEDPAPVSAAAEACD
jgi:hypothetical protein